MENSTFSKKTIQHYTFCIKSLQELYGASCEKDTNTDDFLTTCVHHPDKIVTLLNKSHYQLSSQISMLSALLWFLRAANVDDFSLYPFIHHRDYLQTLLSLEVHTRGGGLSEKEKANYIAWFDILNVYKKALQKALRSKSCDINEFQDFVILALYVLQPPIRADYGNMRVFLEQADVPDNFRDNYFVMYPEPKFVLWRYKNAGRGGLATKADEHLVEGELCDVLEDWLSKNTTQWLLISRKGCGVWGPMSENGLSSRVRSIFRKWTGRTASINTLRHAYVSYVREQGAGSEEKRDIARRMMHHPLTSETYVRVM